MTANMLTHRVIDLYYVKRRDPNTTENDGHACRKIIQSRVLLRFAKPNGAAVIYSANLKISVIFYNLYHESEIKSPRL